MIPKVIPTVEDLKKARKVFLENEPRDLFYRVASELVTNAIEGKTEISLAEALAVLLQTWNRTYYQFRGFDNQHFSDISSLVKNHAGTALGYRKRSILSLIRDDMAKIMGLFDEFEQVLGSVGASKSIHLLAPDFFPLWDRKIAKAYGFGLGPVGTNSLNYCKFMICAREQCTKLKGKLPESRKLLKAIDEYNYCHFTKGWI